MNNLKRFPIDDFLFKILTPPNACNQTVTIIMQENVFMLNDLDHEMVSEKNGQKTFISGFDF